MWTNGKVEAEKGQLDFFWKIRFFLFKFNYEKLCVCVCVCGETETK